MATIIHDSPFYFRSVRKMVAAFGTVFNNVTIQRTETDGTLSTEFKVPIGYGSKQHWYYRIEKGILTPDGSVQESIVVPRIGYILTGVQYDSARALNRNLRQMVDTQDSSGELVRKYQYVPVPFKFNFDLSIYAKNMDDALATMEQIAPYFNPTVNLRILEIEDLDIWNDCQISTSGSFGVTDTYEEGFTGRKSITLDTQFTMTGNLYQPVRTQKVIRKVVADIDSLNLRRDIEDLTVEADPGEMSDINNSTVTIEILQ